MVRNIPHIIIYNNGYDIDSLILAINSLNNNMQGKVSYFTIAYAVLLHNICFSLYRNFCRFFTWLKGYPTAY